MLLPSTQLHRSLHPVGIDCIRCRELLIVLYTLCSGGDEWRDLKREFWVRAICRRPSDRYLVQQIYPAQAWLAENIYFCPRGDLCAHSNGAVF
jgi:hypothetical protein